MSKLNLVLLITSLVVVITGAVLKIFLGANYLISSVLVIGACLFFLAVLKIVIGFLKKSKSS